MEIPSDLILQSIEDGNVYYFVSERIKSTEPHYYICIKKGDDILILCCCTSTYTTSLKYIQRNNLPDETLIHLDPRNNPYLTTNTFVNCNTYFDYTKEDFLAKYNRGEIKFKGHVHNEDYQKILNGLLISPEVEEEIKDILKA